MALNEVICVLDVEILIPSDAVGEGFEMRYLVVLIFYRRMIILTNKFCRLRLIGTNATFDPSGSSTFSNLDVRLEMWDDSYDIQGVFFDEEHEGYSAFLGSYSGIYQERDSVVDAAWFKAMVDIVPDVEACSGCQISCEGGDADWDVDYSSGSVVVLTEKNSGASTTVVGTINCTASNGANKIR